MALKKYLNKSVERLKLLDEIFSNKQLTIVCDKLKNETKVNHDVLYYKNSNQENELIFMFGYDFFIKELADQEFKKKINQNHLDFIIYGAYNKIKATKKKFEKIKISEILNQIQDKEKDSLEIHKFIEKILTQSYYLNWKLEQDKNSIENDYFIEIPDNFLIKIKQRFNLDIINNIYEDSKLFIFLNGKGKLILIFKNIDEFTKENVKNEVFKAIKIIFNLTKINVN